MFIRIVKRLKDKDHLAQKFIHNNKKCLDNKTI